MALMGAQPLAHDPAGSATLGVGVYRFLGLPLTLPIERIVEEAAFNPST